MSKNTRTQKNGQTNYDRNAMIPVDEAVKIVIDKAKPLTPLTASVESTLGFCLAADVVSDIDMPPFYRSAMDGYAVVAEDTASPPVELTVIENIAAGDIPAKKVLPGYASKIMTGAAVPEGANAVVKVEDTEGGFSGDKVKVLKPVNRGKNISERGEDMHVGQIVLRKGTKVRPQEVGILASAGKTWVEIFPAPSVGVISTGNELVDIDKKPSPVQIRNSNGYSLAAQAGCMKAQVEMYGIVRDTKDEIINVIKKGLEKDILIISGGVSMGEYDLVGHAIKELGTQIYFEKVALKPGKPVIFGENGKTLIFALPGNPVASFVTFELFIYPAMRKLMGFSSFYRKTIKASMETDFTSKRKRREFRPAFFQIRDNRCHVSLIEWHGSADLLAMTKANCLLIIPEETEKLSHGQLADIIPLDEF